MGKSVARKLGDYFTDKPLSLEGVTPFARVAHTRPTRIDWRAVERQARQRLQDWRALLGRHVARARELFRELLVAPIRCTPFVIGERKGCRFEGEAAIAGLVRGLVEIAPM